MIVRWLHIDDPGGDRWIHPILGAINEAVEKGICSEIDSSVRELGIHISTRINMLPYIIKRINLGWNELYEQVREHEDKYVYEKNKDGYAIRVNEELKYQLIIDIDSFLFETNSCAELIRNFLSEIYQNLGIKFRQDKTGSIIRQLIIDSGEDASWFEILVKNRNFFIHEGAPYIAIDISSETPDLIIMKENLREFNNPSKFTTLSELDSVLKGFTKAKAILQKHIISICKSRNA